MFTSLWPQELPGNTTIVLLIPLSAFWTALKTLECDSAILGTKIHIPDEGPVSGPLPPPASFHRLPPILCP
jgi:hypothetical protein